MDSYKDSTFFQPSELDGRLRKCRKGASIRLALLAEVTDPLLLLAFDIPFLGLATVLPPRLLRHVVLVPRSSGVLHTPWDRERIAWERAAMHTLVSDSSGKAMLGIASTLFGSLASHTRQPIAWS